MNKILISIIVPYYNNENYIKKCIESLLEQTYANIEIILVDDGSTDNSLKICNSYAKNDQRIKIIHKNNGGISSARNSGLEIAKGDYIGFVDSDDFIENNMYELMLDDILKNKTDISICNIFYETHTGKEIYKYSLDDFSFNRDKFPFNIYHNLSINGYCCNKLYSRNIIFNNKNIIQFDSHIGISEDGLFNYEIFDKNNFFSCSYINKKLYHYIQIKSSVCNRKFSMKKLEYFITKEKQIDILKRNGIDNNFLKIDYVVNFCKTNILIKKFNLTKNELYQKIYNKNREYISTISIKNEPLRLKIKYLISRYLPWIYEIKILIKKENI